jgi:hypothetical protein
MWLLQRLRAFCTTLYRKTASTSTTLIAPQWRLRQVSFRDEGAVPESFNDGFATRSTGRASDVQAGLVNDVRILGG